MAKKLPKGIRKFIRGEKARIRRLVMDAKEQLKLIEELKNKFRPVKLECAIINTHL